MSSGIFVSKLMKEGKIFNSCFCSDSTNKVSNRNYERNEKQRKLFLEKNQIHVYSFTEITALTNVARVHFTLLLY